MSKNDITELLKKKEVLLQSHAKELDFLTLAVERLNDRDYEGLISLANQRGISLQPFFEMLENKTVEYMKTGLPLRSYEYFVLELMFSGKGESRQLLNLGGERPMEKSMIHELHILLSSSPFDEKQISRLKNLIDKYNLSTLQYFIWELGVTEFFRRRYRELTDDSKEEITAQEVMKKLTLAEIFDEEQLIDDFIYFEIKNSQLASGAKTDLYLEKVSKEKADELVKSLYAELQNYPCDFDRFKQLVTDLHMNRQVMKIELDGIEAFRKYINRKWAVGAEAVARGYGFTWHGSSRDDTAMNLSEVNESFMNQALLSKKGKSFLYWEAVLNNPKRFDSAKSYLFPGGYLMVVFLPEKEEEHYLFGYYPLNNERNFFVALCLAEVYRYDSLQQAAHQIILHYLRSFSGAIRLKNALKIALIALPVVALASLMVGWIYKYTLGQTFGAFLIGGALAFIGEAIAARNGYCRKVKPENHEKIPAYIIRQRGVLKIMPVSVEID